MGQSSSSYFSPRSARAVIVDGLKACLEGGGTVWLTAAAMLLVPSALTVAGQYLVWNSGAGDLFAAMQKGDQSVITANPGEFLSALAVMVVVGVITGGLTMVAQYAAGASVARVIAERALGRPFGVLQAWDQALGQAGRIVGGAFLALLVAMAGAVAGEIPGLIVAGALSAGLSRPGAPPPPAMKIAPIATMMPVLLILSVYLASMAAVTGVENRGGFAALTRSWQFAKGRFWHILAVLVPGLLVAAGLPGAVGYLGQIPAAAHWRDTWGAAPAMAGVAALSALLTLLLYPLLFSVTAHLYLDLRARQADEAFGPYELALDVGGELPAGVAPGEAPSVPGAPAVPAPPEVAETPPPPAP